MKSDLAWILKLILVSLLLTLGIKTLGTTHPLPETNPVVLTLLLFPTGLMALILTIRGLGESRHSKQVEP